MRLASSVGGQACPAVDGKFLQLDGRRFLLRGVSYGTFAPGPDATHYPDRPTLARDFAMMRAAGINTVRIYTPPPPALLDLATEHDLRLMIGLPWAQHIAFLDERELQRSIRSDIARHVKAYAGHPATLLLALGNEIHPSVVRWHGHRAIERFLRALYDAAKSVAPDALFTYVNYPPTEYLDVSFFDVCSFNVYLHEEARLRAYVTRMQHIAGHKPLLVAEAGADSIRHGEAGQAQLTAMQLRTALDEGACGAVAFAWTDEWWRGGVPVDDWAFGLVDTARRPKPALRAVSEVFASVPPVQPDLHPRVSVVVCAYNAEATIDECLSSLGALRYRDVEVIAVNDGSTDSTGERISRYPFVRRIDVAQAGLSNARNVGLHAATGAVVAYCDADVRVDPQWLDFLVRPFADPRIVGAGGPNIVPADDGWVAQCVARAPGAPTHVLLTDEVAEHVPGCNMAFRRDVLIEIAGFNPVFLRAGDDVDLCWRLQAACGRIGFAPAALVWHRHRGTIGAYWRQQVGYGEGEVWLRPFHPEKFAGRHILWRGLVYSPLPFARSLFGRRVNSGVWGSADFPTVYRVGAHPMTYVPHSAGWQIGALLLVLAGVALLLLGARAGAFVLASGLFGTSVTAWKCLAHAYASDLRSVPPVPGLPRPLGALVYRIVIAVLHFIQPLARLRGRIRGLMNRPAAAPTRQQVPRMFGPAPLRHVWDGIRLAAGRPIELTFWGESWTSNSELLMGVVTRLRESRIGHRIEIDDGCWTGRDISVAISPLARLDLQSLVEDHGAGKCLFRANVRLHARWLSPVFTVMVIAAFSTIVRAPFADVAAIPAVVLAALVVGVVVQASHGGVVMRDTVRRAAAQFQMQVIAPRPTDMARIPHPERRITRGVIEARRTFADGRRRPAPTMAPRPLAARSRTVQDPR